MYFFLCDTTITAEHAEHAEKLNVHFLCVTTNNAENAEHAEIECMFSSAVFAISGGRSGAFSQNRKHAQAVAICGISVPYTSVSRMSRPFDR